MIRILITSMKNKIDLIEEYLAGDLSGREQTEFEELLRNDPDLMKEFLLRKEINEAISENDVMDLRNNLNEIINSKTKVRTIYRNPFVLSSVAAVVIFLIVISGFYLFSNKTVNGTEMFNSYYSTYPTLTSFRSSVDQTYQEQLLNEAFNSYDDDKFSISSDYFQQILNTDKSNTMVQFYMALCEIELNNFDTSEILLNELVLKNNHIFWEQAHWYLALVYLKQNDIENAKSIFEIIIKEDMTKKPESDSIIKSLNQ